VPTQQPHPKYLLLGEILRPHGVRGELRVRVLTDYPERITHLDTVYIGNDPDADAVSRFPIEALRMHQNYLLLKLEGVDDREAADQLRQLFVMVDLENAVPLEEDELYLFQLIGLHVETDSGQLLGKISEVLETGANDVYVVDSPTYGEILIPVLPDTIVHTDLDAGTIVVHLLDGILPSP
jgi:16S rRNA processing protein RimM